jgi:hypothetical protein
MHEKEIDNRMKKAQRFLGHLDAVMPEATAGTLTLLGDASWKMLADQAGEKPPSNSTISTIIAMVRGREIAVEAIRGSLSRESGVRS